ncbi:hypothetical protein QAD02_009618 [Eretmocerus hayati]|uniref:Uncharacterized protein n=1 Tax=Eretmocerus hayati TaxID=131215 RepID=A0ACC2N9Y3_9HYME|nr:hypothetical protein QAD02_009618 [Eretmocerus hayati]
MQSNENENIKTTVSRSRVKFDSAPKPIIVASRSGISKSRPPLATITNRATLPEISSRKRISTVVSVGELVDKSKAIQKKKITTKDMIIEAITALREEAGSTVASIKEYVLKNHNVDEVRAKYMERKLRSAHQEGWLIQTSGAGSSSGSRFKLPGNSKQKSENSASASTNFFQDKRTPHATETNFQKGSILVREDSGEKVQETKKKVSWDKRDQILYFNPTGR